MPAASKAPDIRLTSRPRANRIIVGIRILNCAGDRLLPSGVDLQQTVTGLQLPGGLFRKPGHHAAGPAPGRPEVDQQRDITASVGSEIPRPTSAG